MCFHEQNKCPGRLKIQGLDIVISTSANTEENDQAYDKEVERRKLREESHIKDKKICTGNQKAYLPGKFIRDPWKKPLFNTDQHTRTDLN